MCLQIPLRLSVPSGGEKSPQKSLTRAGLPLPLQRRVGARNQAPGAQHRAGEAQQTSFYSGLYGVTLGHQIPLVAQTFVINRYARKQTVQKLETLNKKFLRSWKFLVVFILISASGFPPELLRRSRGCFEGRLGKQLPSEHVLTQWLVLWAAEVLNKSRVHPNGRTTYEMVRVDTGPQKYNVLQEYTNVLLTYITWCLQIVTI